MNPERLNIKDLTIEDPEKKVETSSVVFNPERDVTEDEWDEMKTEFLKNIENSKYITNRLDSLTDAVWMKILFPERSDELNLTENLWDDLKSIYDSEFRSEYTSDTLMKMKILFPEKFNEFKPDLASQFDKMKWESMKEELAKYKKESLEDEFSPTSNFSELARKMKIAFPEKVQELGLDDEIANQMKRYINDNKDRWYNFLTNAANFKILFPERTNELNLDDKFWKNAKKVYKTGCQGLNPSFFAESLKVLAAEKIDITDNGLEFTMPTKAESIQSANPEIPEQRNF